MNVKDFFSFRQNKFFWGNIAAMIAVVCAILFGVLKALDIYTRHGEAVVVPDVRGMRVAEAGALLARQKLSGVVSDSSYVKELPAGVILDYTPSAGQKVKEGRVIYLTVNTLSIPLRSVPEVSDNSSMREAQARITAVGFKLAENEYIPGEKDWVYAVKYKGVPLATGEKVPTGATLTLVVGDGSELPQETDSTGTALSTSADTPSAPAGDSPVDESWF